MADITINNMTLHEVSIGVKHEPILLKIGKLMAGLVTGIVAIVCCSYFGSNYKNVTGLQTYCGQLVPADQQIYCSNSTLYDNNYIPLGVLNFTDGTALKPTFDIDTNFTDPVAAKEYIRLLGNCDEECQTLGTRWSQIYYLGCVAMSLFAGQAVLVMAGVWLYPVRLFALSVQSIFCLFNQCVVITVSVFRFNTMGKLASLSLYGSTYTAYQPDYQDAELHEISTETTYADDGQLIFGLWVTSLIFVVMQCILGCFAVSPPTQDMLREWGVKVNAEDEEEDKVVEVNVDNLDDNGESQQLIA